MFGTSLERFRISSEATRYVRVVFENPCSSRMKIADLCKSFYVNNTVIVKSAYSPFTMKIIQEFSIEQKQKPIGF